MSAVLTNLESEVADVVAHQGDSVGKNAARVSTDKETSKRHLLTVNVEDYFQVASFNHLIDHDQWYRFESRLATNIETTLDLLERHETKATFFTLGWIAECWPEMIRSIADAGHEVASRGFLHKNVRDYSPEEFREDVRKSRDAIGRATGQEVVGYRVADGWFTPDDLWALDILAEEGHRYDSSILPALGKFSNEPWRRFLHRHETSNNGTNDIWEVPPSTRDLLGVSVPIAGGNYFRQLPHRFMKRGVNTWHEKNDAPFVMYFHIWELDPNQPEITAAGRLTRMRHYRNLDKMRWVLDDYLSNYDFAPIADYLQLEQANLAFTASDSKDDLPIVIREADENTDVTVAQRTPISIVIPCFNEESSLPYLARTLESVEFSLGGEYCPEFVFVDDCSTDTTWDTMHAIFADKDNFRFIRHEQNKGVAGAILTGIHGASNETVCSMDCDCTYDPHHLANLLPFLEDDVDLVTASPYHPEGNVKNVPNWRLFLSKGLSAIYRQFLKEDLHTYTSCFRVYRKSAVEQLDLKENGFLGVAELLAKLSLSGSRIVEVPATLEVRIFGESKMKTYRTIIGHLGLLARMTHSRLFQPSPKGKAANDDKQKLSELGESTNQHSTAV